MPLEVGYTYNRLTIRSPGEASSFTVDKLLGQQLSTEGNLSRVDLSTGDLPRGTYVLTAHDGGGHVVAPTKFIKNK